MVSKIYKRTISARLRSFGANPSTPPSPASLLNREASSPSSLIYPNQALSIITPPNNLIAEIDRVVSILDNVSAVNCESIIAPESESDRLFYGLTPTPSYRSPPSMGNLSDDLISIESPDSTDSFTSFESPYSTWREPGDVGPLADAPLVPLLDSNYEAISNALYGNSSPERNEPHNGQTRGFGLEPRRNPRRSARLPVKFSNGASSPPALRPIVRIRPIGRGRPRTRQIIVVFDPWEAAEAVVSLDLGILSERCPWCDARFFQAERTTAGKYNTCCNGAPSFFRHYL